jgi:hypothetical protein
MEQHEFEIEIRPDGKIMVHIKGVKGNACLEYAKMFEQIAGGPAQLENTHEFYAPPTDVRIDVEQKTEG